MTDWSELANGRLAAKLPGGRAEQAFTQHSLMQGAIWGLQPFAYFWSWKGSGVLVIALCSEIGAAGGRRPTQRNLYRGDDVRATSGGQKIEFGGPP